MEFPSGLVACRSCPSCAPDILAGDAAAVGEEPAGFSDESAVVAAAFDEDPAAPPFGNGANRPPLNEILVDCELAREPGRNGEGTGGEWAIFVTTRLGEAEGGPFAFGTAGGDLLRDSVGGVAGIVSNVDSVGPACARRRDKEDGPADAEFDRLRTGNRCELGDLVAPKGSAAEDAFCATSSKGGLIGLSKGGELDNSGCVCFVDDFRRFEASAPGRVQSSTSNM